LKDALQVGLSAVMADLKFRRALELQADPGSRSGLCNAHIRFGILSPPPAFIADP
jgi:hypothetical protein